MTIKIDKLYLLLFLIGTFATITAEFHINSDLTSSEDSFFCTDFGEYSKENEKIFEGTIWDIVPIMLGGKYEKDFKSNYCSLESASWIWVVRRNETQLNPSTKNRSLNLIARSVKCNGHRIFFRGCVENGSLNVFVLTRNVNVDGYPNEFVFQVAQELIQKPNTKELLLFNGFF